jgi:hypothetical protein
MLRSLVDLEHYTLLGTDSPIPLGKVRDIYFDDETWMVRYLVVETGTWLDSRKVLISPRAVREADWPSKLLRVGLTQAQVRNSPDIDVDQPVSRQQERTYSSYYGYPYYWERAGLWGGGPYPELVRPGRDDGKSVWNVPAAPVQADTHLRSGRAVGGYHIHAIDGDIGHAQGLLVEEQTWAIRFLFVKTSNWWLGHHVLMAPEWIERVSWSESALYIDLTRAQVLDAPTFDSAASLDREGEIGVFQHYGRPGYWTASAPGSERVP